MRGCLQHAAVWLVAGWQQMPMRGGAKAGGEAVDG